MTITISIPLLIFLILIISLVLLVYGAYIGAKLAIHRLTYILYANKRMPMTEVNKYCSVEGVLTLATKKGFSEDLPEEARKLD